MFNSKKFFQNLLDTDDPLEVVWQEMNSLYLLEAFPEDLVKFYNEQETVLSQFEQMLYLGYFELYDLLEKSAKQQNGSYITDKLQSDNNIVIISDSLSVREIGLLQKRLEEKNWRLHIETFAVAPFPTLTASLSNKLLGTNPSNGKDSSFFCYRYVAGPGQVPNLPENEPTLVWLRLPDKELEQVTVSQTTTIADAFNATVDTLNRILDGIEDRLVYITSDHGYIYGTSSLHFWQMPSNTETTARKVFSRESRAKSKSNENITVLPGREPKEQRHFVSTKTDVGVLGRYWWATGGQNDRCTGHGGLSFVESLVPMLVISPSK